MNALTWGELKKLVAETETAKDSDPVYIEVMEESQEEGVETGSVYALSGFSSPCAGGYISFVGHEGGMDDEDEVNLL